METTPTSRADGLIRRARRRAFQNGVNRSLLRGGAVACLLAAALTLGYGPGFNLLLPVVPALVVVILGIRGARVSGREAALLLDRAAGTKERFTAARESRDPEVRELAATQALDSPKLGGPFPVRFPPSREGLASALCLFLLLGVLFLVPRSGSGEGNESARRRASTPGGGAGAGGDPATARRADPGTPEDPPTEDVTRAEQAFLAGRDLPDADWEELEKRGVLRRTREAVREALANGDREGALERLKAALARARPAPVAGTDVPPGGSAALRWEDYESARAEPTWDPRHDRIVRRYFERIRDEGGR